jgi:hypothetical protein
VTTHEEEVEVVKIDKDTIMSVLRDRGDNDAANRAQGELPDEVDTDKDAGLLDRFGINPQDLLGKFTGQ